MAERCPICEHQKKTIIERYLPAEGKIGRTVPARFGVTMVALQRHREHMPARQLYEPSDGISAVEAEQGWARLPYAATTVTPSLYTQFTQAWHLAKDDERLRQKMVAFIQEQLMQDDMGL